MVLLLAAGTKMGAVDTVGATTVAVEYGLTEEEDDPPPPPQADSPSDKTTGNPINRKIFICFPLFRKNGNIKPARKQGRNIGKSAHGTDMSRVPNDDRSRIGLNTTASDHP